MAAGKAIEDNEDVVEYEMYKVRMYAVRTRKFITHGFLGHMEYSWIPRISPQNADLRPSFYRRRKLRTCEVHHCYTRIRLSLILSTGRRGRLGIHCPLRTPYKTGLWYLHLSFRWLRFCLPILVLPGPCKAASEPVCHSTSLSTSGPRL